MAAISFVYVQIVFVSLLKNVISTIVVLFNAIKKINKKTKHRIYDGCVFFAIIKHKTL